MKRTRLQPIKPIGGSDPAAFVDADAEAIQAVMAGSAEAHQQKRAIKWILESACGLPIWAYRDSARETDVALGRQFVGQQIMGLARVSLAQLRRNDV